MQKYSDYSSAAIPFLKQKWEINFNKESVVILLL